MRGCRSLAGILSVGAETPRDVYVRVNPARQHGQAAQVVIYGPGLGVNRRDLRTLDHNSSIVQQSSLAIEHRARCNHDALGRRRRL